MHLWKNSDNMENILNQTYGVLEAAAKSCPYQTVSRNSKAGSECKMVAMYSDGHSLKLIIILKYPQHKKETHMKHFFSDLDKFLKKGKNLQ